MSDLHEKADLKKGAFLVLVGWLFFTLLIALSRPTSTASSVPTALLFQNLISLICILPAMVKNGGSSWRFNKFKLIFLRTFAGYLNFAFIFLAIQRISLVNTILLRNCAPFFIPLIIWIWKKATLSYQVWLGIILGFVGIGFILKPNIAILNEGTLFGLGSAICFAVSMIAQRRLIKTEPIPSILFYYFLLGTVVSLPFALYTWKAMEARTLIQLILIGVFSFLGQSLFLRAFQYAKPSVLSTINYASVIYAAVLQWLVWKQFPDWLSIIGIFFICVGGVVTIFYSKAVAPK